MPIPSLEAGSINQPSVADDVGANVQMLEYLGQVGDRNREAVTAEVKADFEALQVAGQTGEKLVVVPQQQVPLAARIAVFDGLNKSKNEGVPRTYVDGSLWVPGTERGSYTEEQLSWLGAAYGSQWVAHGRAIVPSAENSEEPILHYVNKPFDGEYAEKGEKTQREAIAERKETFEAENPELDLSALAARDIVSLAVTRLIKGQKLPMEWGFMRDATLPRTTVGGYSLVGNVDSDGGQLRLDGSDGDSVPGYGVGLAVGQKQLDPQAS